MSEESNEPEATIAAGNSEIKHCPFCGSEFAEFMKLNSKVTCPNEGGCGTSFAVFKK